MIISDLKYIGLSIYGADEIVGTYYEKGVYKNMTFDNLLTHIFNETPLPKTFEKDNIFDAFYCINGTAIMPGKYAEGFKNG